MFLLANNYETKTDHKTKRRRPQNNLVLAKIYQETSRDHLRLPKRDVKRSGADACRRR